MAEYKTCYEGCRCSECRQRRSDYFLMNEYRSYRDIDQSEPINSYYELDSAMNNLEYSSSAKKALRKKYSYE